MHALMLGGRIGSHLDIFGDTQKTKEGKEGRKEKASFNINPTEIFSEQLVRACFVHEGQTEMPPSGASMHQREWGKLWPRLREWCPGNAKKKVAFLRKGLGRASRSSFLSQKGCNRKDSTGRSERRKALLKSHATEKGQSHFRKFFHGFPKDTTFWPIKT